MSNIENYKSSIHCCLFVMFVLIVGCCLNTAFASDEPVQKPTDKDIEKIVANINKQYHGIKHSYNGGSLDCISLSEEIFGKLKMSKVPCKFVKYPSAEASSGYHRVILVKYSSGFKLFDYSGMDKLFDGSLSKSLKGKLVKEYEGQKVF